MKSYLGVDIGTTGVKAAIFDIDGRLQGQSFVPTKLSYPAPGQVEQKPEEILSETMAAVEGAVQSCPGAEIAAMSFDGQMAGLMGIDEEWNATTHYDSWLDTRCEKQIHRMNQHKSRIIGESGSAPGFFFGPKLLWWKEERPDVYQKTASFIEPSVYVVGKLAGLKGRDAYIDYTYIHFTNLCQNKAKAWSDELCDLFGVDGGKLPRIVSPTDVVGYLTPEYAVALGLKPGTPIAAGCGDTAAGLLGAGLVEPGESVDTSGTASVLTFCGDRFRPDVEGGALISSRSVIEGLWYSLAYINGGGLCIEWFVDEFGGADQNNEDVYAGLNEKAAVLPVGSEGLIFCPHFAGRNFPYEPNLRGSWSGLNWKHKKEHMYRSLLEGLAFEYRHYLNNFRRLFPDLDLIKIRNIGGGSKSNFWRQIKADCLGVPYATLREMEFGALGSALVAAAAVSDVTDLKTRVLKINREIERINPVEDNFPRYSTCYEDYVNTINGLIQIYNRRKGPS